ncbi:hypothetical protein C8A03DRAFT_13559 [Achaetomium macrosporum]|uniref:Uncharacterized protein n=1 Tax=Achaetomium macrosporum TaxID=79813 RepID=A0AAN7CDJ6_9PEZI|nr:hypothetical protein C8A03DRAFT_13559 [Achaetomium macrosporum]
MAAFDILLILLFFVCLVVSDSDDCYLPHGQLAESATGCWDPAHGPTALYCRQGDLCLNNSLCQNRSGDLYRVFCLDSTWSSAGCPNFCIQPEQRNDSQSVLRCKGLHKWYCATGGLSNEHVCEVIDDKVNGAFVMADNFTVYATAGTQPKLSSLTDSAQWIPTTAAPPPAKDSPTPKDSSIGHGPASTAAPSVKQTLSGSPSVETPDSKHDSSGPGGVYVSTPPKPSQGPVSTDTPITSIDMSDSKHDSSGPGGVYISFPTQSSQGPLSSDTAIPSTTATTSDPDVAGQSSPATAASGTVSCSESPTAVDSNTSQDNDKGNLAVPIGIGVGIGTSVVVAASVFGFFYMRKRRRQAPVRAETPPPFEFPLVDDQGRGWPGPPYGTRLPQMRTCNTYVPELGGSARYELP